MVMLNPTLGSSYDRHDPATKLIRSVLCKRQSLTRVAKALCQISIPENAKYPIEPIAIGMP